jgi:hypothetical protein
MVNGLALRIENAGLEGDEDAVFHGRAYGDLAPSGQALTFVSFTHPLT